MLRKKSVSGMSREEHCPASLRTWLSALPFLQYDLHLFLWAMVFLVCGIWMFSYIITKIPSSSDSLGIIVNVWQCEEWEKKELKVAMRFEEWITSVIHRNQRCEGEGYQYQGKERLVSIWALEILRKSMTPFSQLQNRNEVLDRDLGVTYVDTVGETVEMEKPTNKEKKKTLQRGVNVY